MHIKLNAHLLSAQPGYRAAGIHRYIDHLLREIRAAAPDDWRFTAMVGARNQVQYPGVEMRRASLDTESPLRRILWEQLVQPWALAGCDLHHALAFVAPFALQVPAVVTVYDLSFIHYPERLPKSRRLYLSQATRYTCTHARRVIAISKSTAADVAASLDVSPDKIDVAPPGCDLTLFKPLPPAQVAEFRQAQGLPERFWLFIGTLEPRKNLPVLLEAYAALPHQERLPLILAGGKGWDYEPIFAAVERYGLTDEVHFPGYISADMLPFWYNAAEAFIYPSVFEGFGIPVLEAMACGTPVLVSDASSLPEVAGDAGMCVPPHDPAAWSVALRRIYADDAWRAEARQMGLQRAEIFTWRATAEATIASYKRALGLEE
ncbi:MAG: glycosyltransferase family 4 protein [Anaerolineae bacterium]|nr:glycosyltransferase family 4 protein [Anaerolineae bacterium]